MSDRSDFLLHMYDQLMNDINRHIMVVWQSVSVLVGAFAILALVETRVITIDIAVALIILLAAWLLMHLEDASYWYNRNLAMIINIEKQFLIDSDIRDIQYYFGKHRPSKMITHLRIQRLLGIGLASVMIVYHFYERVLPGIGESIANFSFLRLTPYILAGVAYWLISRLRTDNGVKYDEFIQNSPGREVDVKDAVYGIGHGFDKTK